VGSFLWILGVFIAGTLFMLIFPGYSTRAVDWIGREPLRSLGLGFVVLVCLPILAVLLLVTIVGIPLALILFLVYVLLLFFGWVTAALFVGRKGHELTRGARPVAIGWKLGALLLTVIALWLAGQVPYVGGGWITFVAQLATARAIVDVVSVQNRYNVSDRSSDPVLEVCARDGLAFIPWGPLSLSPRDADAAARARLEEFAAKRGVSLPQATVAWLLARSPAMLPIPGTSKRVHVEENVAAAAFKFSPEELREIG